MKPGECWDRDLTEAEKALADNRADFMKRWFAIAISVGFATALSNMPWLKDAVGLHSDWPVDWEQVKQLARLGTAAVATLLSWDGYFQSISNKKLVDGPRFAIDITLVFLYLFLLLTSKFGYFWLWIHAFSFILYCAWDFLSIRMHRRAYVTSGAPADLRPEISEIYIGSLSNDVNIYRGPAITLLWPIYFWSLPLTYQFFLNESVRQKSVTTFIFAILVIGGLFAYRGDKKKKLTLFQRLLVIAMGVALVLGAGFILRIAS